MNFGRLSKKYIQSNNIEDNNEYINQISNNINENNETNNYNYSNKIIISENNIKIKTENYEFHVIIEKMKSGDEYFTMNLSKQSRDKELFSGTIVKENTIYNNKGEYCIRIKIDNDLKNDIYLQHLNFYESCAINKSLIKKTGTIEMLFATLEYIKQQYGNNLQYFFEDDSKIIIEGITLNLSMIYILLYGETWYMKNIKAIPVSIEFSETLNIINNYLINNKDKLSYFFEFNFNNNNNNNNNNSHENIISNKLFNIIKSKYKNKNITKKNLFNKIKKIYNLSSNSRDFLYNLYKYFGMIIFVLIDYYKYYKHITYIFKKSLNFNSYMQIPTDYINSINIIKNIEII
jgi:hypothetical protein